MAATTSTSICNSALIKVGAETITSLDENNKRARLCKEQYEKIKKDLLASHPWNFAIARKDLAQIVDTPLYEFDFAFLIPNDVLRVLSTSLNVGNQIGERKWNVEINPTTSQKILLCNDEQVNIRYLKDIDEAFFSPLFTEVLATKLAFDICYSLTQSATLASLMKQEYDAKLKEARSYDAAEGSVRVVDADDWLLARLAKGPGFYSLDE